MDNVNEVVKIAYEMAKRTDEINKRLIKCVVVLAICFSITVIAIVASYFFSDYQYPTVEQQTTQTDGDMKQETTQNVK